jgi:PiT family inorganic phosphate transporter
MAPLVLVAAAAFALINGMNDLSAISGTSIATRAAHFWQTRLLAILGVCGGLLLASDAVARTVARDLFEPEGVARSVASAVWATSMLGAIAWGWLARSLGIPTSATHAFVGSLIGGTLVLTRRNDVLNWGLEQLFDAHRVGGILKVVGGLLVSPAVGLVLGWMLCHGAPLLARVARSGKGRAPLVRWLEWPALLAQAWFYGANDAHLVVGILMGAGVISAPHLLVLAAIVVGIGHGSASILRNTGRRVCRLRPVQALAAQVGAATGVGLAALVGAPASSTQVTVSALVGVGGAWRAAHIRWREVREVLLAWLVTIPAAALVGAAVGLVLSPFA